MAATLALWPLQGAGECMTAIMMPLIFVVLWSTGFIGARLGLPYSEPMTFLAIRFGLVAIVLAAIIPFVGTGWPSWRQWREQADFVEEVVFREAPGLG